MSDTQSPTPRDVEAAGFEVTLLIVPRRGLEATMRWVEIKTQEQARLAGQWSETAVGHFFLDELKACGEPMPHRWFMLLDMESFRPARVVLCVPGVDVERAPYKVPFHTTGYRNSDPYLAGREDEIRQLGEAIGMEILPNWQGRPVEQPVQPSAP